MMSQTAFIWILILAAIAAANLPFVNERLFGIGPQRPIKSLAVRVGELVVLYFAVGGLGLLLEKRMGQISPQGWEFYAVTAALFVTFAFPGFIWRYLRRHHLR